VKVEISELAYAGLARVEPDSERQKAIASAIKLKVAQPNTLELSFPIPVPPDKLVYMYPIHKFRVTWELLPDSRKVWSIKALRFYTND